MGFMRVWLTVCVIAMPFAIGFAIPANKHRDEILVHVTTALIYAVTLKIYLPILFALD